MAQNVTPRGEPPGWRAEQNLIECLEELALQAGAVRESIRGINDETFAARTGQILDVVARVLWLHAPEPRDGVTGELEELERETDGLRVPRIDPVLGVRTDALDKLRAAMGLLLRAIQDARHAAETARGQHPIPRQPVAVDSGKVRAMLQRLDRVETELKDVARERDSKPTFVQQYGLINLYVDKMRVKLDLARLHLTIADVTFDLGALTSVVEAMGEITVRFQATVKAWVQRVSALLIASSGTVGRAVTRVVQGARTLGKFAMWNEHKAATERSPDPDMVVIPSGRFVMGIPEAESERERTGPIDKYARPQHDVTFQRPFLLGKYPVTRGEYAEFARETNRAWEPPDFAQTDRHPAVNVGFADAMAYADWLSRRTGQRYRLPSEAEWEYACRAGTTTARYWGDKFDPKRGYFDLSGTVEVGSYPANPLGLFDMLGNVAEWVEDTWHNSYEGAPDDGSAWTTRGSAGRVVRGGWWHDDDHGDSSRCGNRDGGEEAPSPRVGFRLARTI